MNNLVPAAPRQFADLQLIRAERDVPQSTGLEQVFAALYRQRYLLAACVALCTIVAALLSLVAPHTYTAVASVQLEQQAPSVFRDDVLDPQPAVQDSDRFLQTQLDRLRSASIAERVSDELRLSTSPASLKAIGVDPSDPAQTKGHIIAALQDGMRARLGLNTRIAEISFTSGDPKVSALIANGFASALEESNLDSKQEASTKAKKYLLTQLTDAKQRLETSEREMLAYARKKDLTTTVVPNGGANDRGGSLRSQQLGALTDSLTQATARRIDAQQRWAQVQGTAPLSLPEVESNKAVQDLYSQRAELEAKLEEDRQRYTDEYPSVKETEAKIGQLDTHISSFASSIKSSFYGQYLAAAQQERQMQQSVASLRGAAMSERERSVGYNSLSREVETNKAFYDGLLQRYKEIAAASGAAAANIIPLDRAWPPLAPDPSNLKRNMFMGGVAGIMLALMLGGIREKMHYVIRSSEDLEQRINIPALGVVPRIAAPDGGGTLTDQHPAQAEAYHSIAVALQDASSGSLPRTLLVTSSAASEGKSTSAIGIARSLSAMGKRVLLIDGDLRRPSSTKVLGDLSSNGATPTRPRASLAASAMSVLRRVGAATRRIFGTDSYSEIADAEGAVNEGRRRRSKPGLSDVLTGRADADKSVQKSGQNGLSIVQSGTNNGNPVTLLSAERIKGVFERLATDHDIVIVDGPPVMGLADAVLLARSVDAVLVVAEANKTLMTQLNVALARLPESNIIGGIITKFDAKSAGVHYGDYDYYTYDPADGRTNA